MKLKTKISKFNLDGLLSYKKEGFHDYILSCLFLEFHISEPPQILYKIKRKISRDLEHIQHNIPRDTRVSNYKIENIEKGMIANTIFWDATWYCQKYKHKLNKHTALDYWYKIGWLKGESPSKYFNLEYINYDSDINPLIAYLNKSKIFFFDDKNNFKSDLDDKNIEDYLNYQKTRNSKSVVYTCITDNYDNLEEIRAYKYINTEWDYVCFTDNEEYISQGQIGIWKIQPLKYTKQDARRISRWHKLHPHILFPDYDESIYIDPNINILTDKIFNIIKEKNKNFILQEHFERICIYDEFKKILKNNLDNKKVVKRQFTMIKNAGMPINYGFTENNILYRKHNDENIINIMEDWWKLIERGSKRDQLSLTFILWQHGVLINDITFENIRFDWQNFYIFGHQRQTSNTIKNHLKINYVSTKDRNNEITRTRVYNLIPHLKKYFTSVTISNNFENADIVVFQNIKNFNKIKQAKSTGKFVICDIDNPDIDFVDAIKLADLIIVSSDNLKNKISSINNNVVTIDSTIDIDDYNILPKDIYGDRTVIGWYGSKEDSAILDELDLRQSVKCIYDTGRQEDNSYYDVDLDIQSLDYLILPIDNTVRNYNTPSKFIKALYLGIPTFISNSPEYLKVASLIEYPKEYIVTDLTEFKEIIDKINEKNIKLPEIDFDKIRKILLENYSASKISDIFTAQVLDKYPDKLLVSVIMTSYNNGKYIEDAIKSVLSQSYTNFEFIIIDDNSDDNSLEIINKYANIDNRIKVIKNNNNLGLAKSLQKGFAAAQGRWIATIDSDDMFMSEYLETKLKIADKHTNIGLIFNRTEFICSNNEHKIYNSILNSNIYINNPKNMFYSFGYNNPILTMSSVMFKKEYLKYIDFNTPIDRLFDWYFYIQLAKYTDFYGSNKKITAWRIHPDSYMKRKAKTTFKFANISSYLNIYKKNPLNIVLLIFILISTLRMCHKHVNKKFQFLQNKMNDINQDDI